MILYILDSLAVLILLGSRMFPKSFLLFFSICLVIKGALFAIFGKDWASVVDLIVGIYMFMMFLNFGIYFLTALSIIWLMQKVAVFFILRISG